MKVVDKRGVWMTNTSQFRMHDPMTNTYLEIGEPTKATDSPWRQANKAIIPLTDEEGTIVDDPDVVIDLAAVEAAEAAPVDVAKKSK